MNHKFLKYVVSCYFIFPFLPCWVCILFPKLLPFEPFQEESVSSYAQAKLHARAEARPLCEDFPARENLTRNHEAIPLAEAVKKFNMKRSSTWISTGNKSYYARSANTTQPKLT
jgi:hypothetical protein